MTNIYHATPYDISASGFYFNSYEDYLAKLVSHTNDYGDPVEEFEIQFIDGDNYRLFEAVGVNQANLKDWFEKFESLDGDDAIKAIYLAEGRGYRLEDALDRLEDVHLFEGTAIEYAENHIEDNDLLSQIPENLRYYFDTETFARDMLLGGDIVELEVDSTQYIIQACF